MSASVEELARQIASLDESELRALLDRLDELSLRHDIRLISEHYQKRLLEHAEVNGSADDILQKLKQIREEIAAREYPG